MPRTIRRPLIALLGFLLAAGTVLAVASPAIADGNLRATLSLTGTTGEYAVTNTGSADVTGWAITYGEHGLSVGVDTCVGAAPLQLPALPEHRPA